MTGPALTVVSKERTRLSNRRHSEGFRNAAPEIILHGFRTIPERLRSHGNSTRFRQAEAFVVTVPWSVFSLPGIKVPTFVEGD